jgi:hypothetical protein
MAVVEGYSPVIQLEICLKVHKLKPYQQKIEYQYLQTIELLLILISRMRNIRINYPLPVVCF